jgi:hypothetical protein
MAACRRWGFTVSAAATVTARRPAAARSAQPTPLGRYANNSSPSPPAPGGLARRERKHKRRRERHKLRYGLRKMTKLRRVRDCGWTPITGDGAGPGLRLSVDPKGGNIAGLSGLASCGSVWSCPVCSAKIATRRAEDLAYVMRFALDHGCSASMVTLTMRHHEGQSLKDCWDALSKGWAAVTSGKQWVNDCEAFDYRGWVKAVEVTRGANGWHVHIHALLIWDSKINQKDATHVAERMHRRWSRALEKRGFESWRDSGGLDVRLGSLKPGTGSGLHEYFVKLSHEITGGQAKLAKGGGRTPFQILADFVAAGGEVGCFESDLALWREWEQASFNRRQIAWSKGLREWAGLGREQTDEEIAQEELAAEDVLMLEPESWHELRHRPDQVCELLEVTEGGGFPAAMSLLDRLGLAYVMVSIPPPPPPPPRDHEHWVLRRDRADESRRLIGSVARALSHA